ncbi:MAG TPA: glycosyl hydrolase family 65 protein [Vicinamibacterales bacterium]|nr:glycosyl hydrolase family 65 protein [Vicinamibacterales bacterium]
MTSRRPWIGLCLAAAAALLSVAARSGEAIAESPRTIPRFDRGTNPIALVGPARPARYLEASGRRAALLGREDGSFEAWVYPLKVLHDFTLAFGTPAYAEPIPGAALAAWVEARPESALVRYAHAAFTADAVWLVPHEEPGALVLLDIETSVPLEITVRFHIDLKPMWPAALGGQYSYWDKATRAFVAGEASRRHWAVIGSPLALEPPEQPAHNLPDAPSQFRIRVTPDEAASGLVPIALAAGAGSLEAVRGLYARLLDSAERLYRDTEAHYARLRRERTAIDTPDDRMDLAFEWAKVALDKGLVCNPDLGCGLIAGLGPSGRTERPGFGWFFGGDAFINAWAITAYGDFETVRRALDFLRERQRADGKMMHELSQGAAYIRWFEEYPYAYYHAETTPLYLVALRDYVRASGDVELARRFLSSIERAFTYCLSTDEDGDGLMDNTRAGLAAVETGSLRRADVLTDVYLAAAWTDGAAAAAELFALTDHPLATRAQEAHARARAALDRRFADDDAQAIRFAVLRDGQGRLEPTVWPAFGLWRGLFDRRRPAVIGTLDRLAGAGIGTDWGARMLSRESALYEPLSYNNGAVWPFLSGFAALALYAAGREPAARAYLEGTAALTFLDARGFVPELLSGDRLHAVDAAVPHQLFSSAGFLSAFVRGLLGLREPPATEADAALRLEPALPPSWNALSIERLRWRDAVIDVRLAREADAVEVSVTHRGTPRPVVVRLVSPPGGEVETRELRFDPRGAATRRVRVRPGIEIDPVAPPFRTGDPSSRLRVIETRLDGTRYTARLQGLAGRRYRVRLRVPFAIESADGGTIEGTRGGWTEVAVEFPRGEGWVERALVLTLGRRPSARSTSGRLSGGNP